MEGKSYELPDDITNLGGMVTWADRPASGTRRFSSSSRTLATRSANTSRTATPPTFRAWSRSGARPGVLRRHGDRPRAGRVAVRPRSRMTRVLLVSAVVMDAAGWACTAQGAYGLARVCFSAAVPFIVAWAFASLRG